MRDFSYSLYEMDSRIEGYFSSCAEEGKDPTVSGLCLFLELPFERLKTLLRHANAAADSGEREPSLQWGHVKKLQRALLRIQDCYERRSDTMAKFQLSQYWLGGYSEKQTAAPEPAELKLTVALKSSSESPFA